MGRTSFQLGHQGTSLDETCAGPIKELHKADVIAVSKENLISAKSTCSSASNKEAIAPMERILQLETLDVDLFRGISSRNLLQTKHMFGGEVIAQALAAACKSVDPKLLVHSLHSYFLQIGDPKLPIYYHVTRLRDGRTFATRVVTARQKGQQIFILNASFQASDRGGFEHQQRMPDAPNPDQLLSFEAITERQTVDSRIHPKLKKWFASVSAQQHPLDIRVCDPIDHGDPKQMEPSEKIWIRARGKLSDDQALHRCVAAYASDFCFLSVGLRPHAAILGVHASILSLDHSMWFHRPFRADEWLLLTCESPCANDARGLAFAHIYTQSGELVISVAQEGILRKHDKEKMKSKL